MIEKSKRIWQNGIKGKDLQMAYENDILTRNDNDELAVRTVQSTGDNPASSYDDVYTRDDNGKLAVRVVGGGGGDVDTTKVVNKASVLPTAGSSNLGNVYMYSGETDVNYTHGYIYECQVTTVYEDTTTFQPATISGTVVTATSGAVADLCSEYITGDITEIVSGTMTYDNTGALWVFVGKDSENNTVGTFQIYQSDYEEAGFTFTGTPEDGDVVSFETEITASSTYSWTEVQLGGGGSSYTAGTGIDITSGVISVTSPTLQNTATSLADLTLLGTPASSMGAINIGSSSVASSAQTVAIGSNAKAQGTQATAVGGYGTEATAQWSLALGSSAKATAQGAVQINGGTNNEDNTIKFGAYVNNSWVNYKLLDSDGTIPTARLTKVNSTITLTAAGWSNGSQTVTVSGVTSTSVVLVAPDPSDTADYVVAGILCTSQATNSLTFTATTTPTADIDVNVVCL